MELPRLLGSCVLCWPLVTTSQVQCCAPTPLHCCSETEYLSNPAVSRRELTALGVLMLQGEAVPAGASLPADGDQHKGRCAHNI